MNLTDLLILGFITWRGAHLVAEEHGPFWMFAHLRRSAREACHRNRFCRRLHLHEMLTCEYCNSIWIGMIVAVLYVLFGQVFIYVGLFMALSTMAIFLKKTHNALTDIAKVFLKLSIRIQKSNQ